MKNIIGWLFIWVVSISYGQNSLPYFVNPFIGTGGHGHTYPGATTPFGMVQLSPDTRIDGSWDGCSGYHYSDSLIYGFSHTHLSGTGVSDYGDFNLMPTYVIQNDYQPNDYASRFSHNSERAHAGYYSVYLNDPKIKAEFTTSTRVGFHRYTFDRTGLVRFIMDFTHRDDVLEAAIEPINATTFKLTRRSKAWAQNQHAYAFLQFSAPVDLIILRGKKEGKLFTGNDLLVAFEAKSHVGKNILVKLAYSFTSPEGAEINAVEIPDWDFEKTLRNTENLWQNELSKIEINTRNNQQKSIFYTALYHTMIQPNIAQDVDGKYLGRDFQIHTAKGFDYYTVFSLWDTFRAAHPLYTLIDRKRTRDFVMTFLKEYQQGGRLPVWELSSNETDCMIGYHSVPVIALAMDVGIEFDYNLALKACVNSAMLNHFGLNAYKKKNFIAVEDESESVSKTLEYAYDDFCIAQMAKKLGEDSLYQVFTKRSNSWRNMLDPETHLMRPRLNGGWLSPFDGKEVNFNYTEANAWQYSFFVPQNIEGFIAAQGGNEKMEKLLDEFFTLSQQTTGRTQVDITDLIGQYAHGNEPSHHIAYLYNYVNKPKKAQHYVDEIIRDFYKNTPDGLIGNEDCGQMSAWYVLSTMGMYPVTPNFIQWTHIKPHFDKIRIHLENGETKVITKRTYSESNIDNESIKSDSEQLTFIETPFVVDNEMGFEDQKKIELKAFSTSDSIYYSFDNQLFSLYKNPFYLFESKNIFFYATRNGIKSSINRAIYVKKPNAYSVELLTRNNSQYNGGGPNSLVDGIFGNLDWKKGKWLGYQKDSLEAIIDLKQLTEVDTLGLSYLQDSRSWILFPKTIYFYGSRDGKEFQQIKVISPKVNPFDYQVKKEKSQIVVKGKYRFLKVVATTFGALPNGHQGAGDESFIFVDEILIK